MQYRNILLIDDDEEDQEIFKRALKKVADGLNCTSFTNAMLALDKLTANEINPDVIFLDLNMPIMSGQDFLTTIKQKEIVKDIPVIIFSTSSNPSTIKQTKDLGAIDYITKPNGFDILVNILKPIIN